MQLAFHHGLPGHSSRGASARWSPLAVATVLVALLLSSPNAAASTLRQAGQQSTTGRIVVTITTLEGTVHMSGVQVELRAEGDGTVLAKTVSDRVGQVVFPDVPAGRYTVRATRPGFIDRDSPVFDLKAGEVVQVLVDIQLTFVLPEIEVRAETPSPTDSVQPVSMSDMLAGSLLDVAPLTGDDFQSLLPLLPGVVRGPDGRLRIKGGQPTQGALQVSSASLNDPSSGDFDLELPAQSIESVEVLANPFAAEFGRFTTSITQIRTKRGTNEWQIKPGNLIPRLGKGLTAIRAFEPRFSVRGPLERDRVFLSQDVQFRYVTTPVKSLPDEPEIEVTSFDSFSRVDYVLSSRHTLVGGLITFPREIDGVTMNTFRPPEVTPHFSQSGWSTGIVDRFSLARDIVLESTLSGRWFEINVNTEGTSPMVYAPQTQSGNFFNDQEREVDSLQWVEALSFSSDLWRGRHVFKVGSDLQRSHFRGFSESSPVEVRRLDGSLAELTEFAGHTTQEESGVEVALFAQDRWRLGSRVTLELGLRMDRDAVVQRVNWSPRAGAAIAVLPEGRAIIRGGYGKFVQRAPLNIGAFPSFDSQVVSRFTVDGSPMGAPIAFRNVLSDDLRTPEAEVGNVEWNQRFGRRWLAKIAFLDRRGEHEFILTPDPALGELQLSSTGTSRYRELEATTRYLGGERRDLTVSYVWAKGTADLNNYDQFFGNLRNPIIRANEQALIPTDVRHRLLIRGTFGLPGQWDFSPVLEIRSGFPWSAVDEFQDFVGPRNSAGRLPAVRNLDFSIARPWRFKKFRFRAGLKMYNIFGASAERDVQNNITSPDFGSFYNPIERSIGFVFGAAR
ncbi:MAG TPA: TonB-dependent receptor [Vicinamibacterales bacterium]|nr:TonB-dependent receptor [Vicinamibacterales bacterium]